MNQKLNDLMQFDHVVRVHPDGTVTDTAEDTAGFYAPEITIGYTGLFADAQISDQQELDLVQQTKEFQGWDVLTGWAHDGPAIMHRSQYIGGNLADHIRETPGLWVRCSVEIIPGEEDPEHESNGGNGESKSAGWILAHREGPAWREDGTMMPGGDCGGDVQAGESFSRRFVHQLLPGRLATVTAYPIKGDGTDDRIPEGEIRLEWQTETMVCRDVTDPGSTEVWSDIEYSDLPERFTGTCTSVGSAETLARLLVTTVDPNRDIGWDGRPELDLDED